MPHDIPFVAFCTVVGLLYVGPDTSGKNFEWGEHRRLCDKHVVKTYRKESRFFVETPWVTAEVEVPLGNAGWRSFSWSLGRPVAFIHGRAVKVILHEGQRKA